MLQGSPHSTYTALRIQIRRTTLSAGATDLAALEQSVGQYKSQPCRMITLSAGAADLAALGQSVIQGSLRHAGEAHCLQEPQTSLLSGKCAVLYSWPFRFCRDDTSPLSRGQHIELRDCSRPPAGCSMPLVMQRASHRRGRKLSTVPAKHLHETVALSRGPNQGS